MRHLAGTASLTRAFLWRDRWMLGTWVVGGTLLYYAQTVSVQGLYRTEADLDEAAALMASNPGLIAMTGPARALDTIGGQVAWQASAYGAVVAGLMSMFLVGRHTRAEEESGRDELLRSTVVGRYAGAAAGAVVALAANAVLGILVTLTLISRDLDAVGSLSLGLAVSSTGLVFAAVALVAAQLTTGTRAMYGLVGPAIGAAFVLRAVGDVSLEPAVWLSPIGWGQAMHSFSGERWWPLVFSLATTSGLVAVAFRLLGRRDHGSGVLRPRPGPRTSDISSFGLAWRLQRGSILGWSVGLFAVGAAYGSIGDAAAQSAGDSSLARDLLSTGSSLTDGFLATAALVLALLSAGGAISSALRLRHEEGAARVDLLLSTPISRARWVSSHLVVMFLGALGVLAAGGIGLGSSYAVVSGDVTEIWTLTAATLAYVAPVLALCGLAFLLSGTAPRLAHLTWLPLLFAAVVAMFGQAADLPHGLTYLSPFEHVARMPAEPFNTGPVLWVLAFALVCAGLGARKWFSRDLG